MTTSYTIDHIINVDANSSARILPALPRKSQATVGYMKPMTFPNRDNL